MQVLRAALGPGYELSFAAGGFREYLRNSVEWAAVMPLVDRVNLMSYNLVNGYSTTTGHHTPLYATPQQRASVNEGVRYLDSVGVVPGKVVVIGAALLRARLQRRASRRQPEPALARQVQAGVRLQVLRR